MKIILVMVMSVDGKTTKWNDPKLSIWTSREDKDYFAKVKSNAKCIIMGRKTYDTAKGSIQLSPNTLRIIITRNPANYSQDSVPGQLEFTREEPKNIVDQLTSRNYDEIFLLGGETLNEDFLQCNLVDEVWLTVEPVLFGVGNGLTGNKELDKKLTLLSFEKLNSQGTLLLKYQILK